MCLNPISIHFPVTLMPPVSGMFLKNMVREKWTPPIPPTAMPWVKVPTCLFLEWFLNMINFYSFMQVLFCTSQKLKKKKRIVKLKKKKKKKKETWCVTSTSWNTTAASVFIKMETLKTPVAHLLYREVVRRRMAPIGSLLWGWQEALFRG